MSPDGLELDIANDHNGSADVTLQSQLAHQCMHPETEIAGVGGH